MLLRHDKKQTLLFIFTFFIAIVLSKETNAKTLISELGNRVYHKVSIDSYQSKKLAIQDKVFVKLSLNNEEQQNMGVHYEIGAPEIPVIRFYAFGDIKIKHMNSDSKISFVKGKITPNHESHVKIKNSKRKIQTIDRYYSSKELYPSHKKYSIEKAGSIRGQQQYLVTLYPIQIQPSTGKLIFNTSFEVQSDKQKAQTQKNQSYAIVTNLNFQDSPSLNAYAQLKSDEGYNVEWIIVSRELNTAAAIREKLQDLLKNKNLKHALLVGDIEFVPSYNNASINGPSDHYYRAIDTNDYNSDINGPDIGVGRVSARNEAQLKSIFDKFAYYRTLKSIQNWQTQASFLATDDQWEIAEGTHNYAINTYTKDKGYTGIFPQELTPGGDQLYSISFNAPNNVVQEALQEGRSIINYSGHGMTMYWDAPRVTQSDIRAITNTNALPFVISNACITGDFRVAESFAETWQRHPFGAITFWGSMDNTFWEEDDILEKRMYDGIFTQDKKSFSEITQHALFEHWKHYGGAGKSAYYWETYTMFGDPSLEFIAR